MECQSDAEYLWLSLHLESNLKKNHIWCAYLPASDIYYKTHFANDLIKILKNVLDDIVLICGDFYISNILLQVENNNVHLLPSNMENKHQELTDLFSYDILK